jgi:putative glycosyltransferase
VKISVVTTLYHSAPYLQEFYRRAKLEASKISPDLQFIFVNDGSPDESLQIALQLQRADPAIKIIDLSRNFGHHKAMMTGLEFATGDLVFLIDCDLEEDPELLSVFYPVLKTNPDADVVFGVQGRRKGGIFERLSGWLYFKIINLLSPEPIPANLITARLMTRRYVRALISYRESELVIAGLWLAAGFRQIPVTVQKHSSAATTYSFSKKLALFFRSVTSFSDKPLRYIANLGFTIFSISLAYSIALVAFYIVSGKVPQGYTSLIVSIWLLGGLIIFCIGIVAIYLSVVFVETKDRPYTIVRQIYGQLSESSEPNPD